MSKRLAEFDRFPEHLEAKVARTRYGVQYELPFRKSKGTIGLVVIQTFDYVDDPKVSIWEMAREPGK